MTFICLPLQPVQFMCIRIAIDLDLFQTLTENDRPTTLEELATVKNADSLFAGIYTHLTSQATISCSTNASVHYI